MFKVVLSENGTYSFRENLLITITIFAPNIVIGAGIYAHTPSLYILIL